MNKTEMLESLTDARRLIVMVRGGIMFDLPLANAKLIRITEHIAKQIQDLEHELWAEADLLEPEEK